VAIWLSSSKRLRKGKGTLEFEAFLQSVTLISSPSEYEQSQVEIKILDPSSHCLTFRGHAPTTLPRASRRFSPAGKKDSSSTREHGRDGEESLHEG